VGKRPVSVASLARRHGMSAAQLAAANGVAATASFKPGQLVTVLVPNRPVHAATKAPPPTKTVAKPAAPMKTAAAAPARKSAASAARPAVRTKAAAARPPKATVKSAARGGSVSASRGRG
jgi:membrane-bound lytic murein transglycosylase D